MEVVQDVLGWACLLGGGFFCVVGAIGLLRFPDFYTRVHAGGVTDTLGAGLVLVGLCTQSGLTLNTVKMFLLLGFLWLASATTAHALVKAARVAGLEPKLAEPAPDELVKNHEGGRRVIIAIDLFLLALLVLTAVAVIRLRSLFAAVMLTGIYSLLSACWFTLQDAVDVAFTEAAVGAGISTVLMLGTISLTQRNEKGTRGGHPILGLAAVVLTGAALVYATFDMPHWGDPNAPVHTHPIYEEYVGASYDKFHIPNIVTAVLASYRGYDTFGEVTVILTAGVAVLLLLTRRREEEGPSS